MKLYGYNIEFINCSPDETIRKAVREMAGRIKFKAPSNSKIRITLEKNEDVYLGCCRVGSSAGIFVSRSEHKNPLACIKLIERYTNEKLQAWDEQRHSYLKRNYNSPIGRTKQLLSPQRNPPTSDQAS